MSDNPYERDNHDEPTEPQAATGDGVPPAGTTAAAPGHPPAADDDGGTAVGHEGGAPAASDDDTRTWPADDTAAAAAGSPGDTETPTWPADDPSGAMPSTDDAPRPAGSADDEPTRPVPLEPARAESATAGERDDAEHRTAALDEHRSPGDADHGADDEPSSDHTQVLRTHQAERPVPRSGLAEHRSAGYLTGERPVPEPQPEPAREQTAPWLNGATATAAPAATAPLPAAPAERPAEEERARPERDVVLDGTTAHTRPPRRTKAHVLTILLTLLLTPVAWYLLADAGARLTLPTGNPWDTANLNVAALLELGGGLLVLVVVLLAARWSSVGAIVTGALVIVVGVPFVAVPAWTQDLLEPVESWLAGLGDFGDNVAHHLVASGSTGRLLAVGVALVLVGVVSHGARRQGRREVRPAVEA